VTVTARDAACTPNNLLSSLQFTSTTNATVDAGGVLAGTGSFSVPVSPAAPATTFFVNRTTAGQAATVMVTVTDGCGAWQTFVGGGPGAF
jgi:hypothetical protein